jgi:small neutral amino acid transporter SnatA (MarC family)
MPEPDPNRNPNPNPAPAPDAKPAAAPNARPVDASPVSADAYTALPERGSGKPRWTLWAALAAAAAVALSLLAAGIH